MPLPLLLPCIQVSELKLIVTTRRYSKHRTIVGIAHRRLHDAQIEHRGPTKQPTLPLHALYRVSSHALTVFESRYLDLFSADETDASFFRRVMWRAPRYALLYHVLLRKRDAIIDSEDMEWGLRVAEVHLHDFRKVMDLFDMNQLATVIDNAEKVRKRIRLEEGREIAPWDLIAKVRNINNAGTARFVLDVLSGSI